MTKDLKIYINGLFFDHLSSSDLYNDRVEFFRTHEKSLWTMVQLAKVGHKITITDSANQVEAIFSDMDSLQAWVLKTYPNFIRQLDAPLYTKYPHPDDFLAIIE